MCGAHALLSPEVIVHRVSGRQCAFSAYSVGWKSRSTSLENLAYGGRTEPIGITFFWGEFVETGSSTSARFGATKPRFGAPCPTLDSRPRT
jgi:hypothetical protein